MSRPTMRHRLATIIFAALAMAFLTGPAHADTTLHVDDDAPPNGDGLTWNTAYRFLQDALEHARNSGGEVTEIRIGQGTYQPDRDEQNPQGTGDRTASFLLVDGVTHAGGYAGFGAPDPDARDVDQYPTNLSGDLNGDDEPGFVNYDDNSERVIVADALDLTTTLDGLVVTAGNGGSGSGTYAVDCVDLRVLTCRFSANAGSAGPGIYAWRSNLDVADCLIDGNRGVGAIYAATSTVTVTRCTFTANRGSSAPCLVLGNQSDAVCVDCDFIENNGGAVKNFPGNSLQMIDCRFERNSNGSSGSAVWGGGITTLLDCTFLENWTGGTGGTVYLYGSVSITRCRFLRNNASFVGGAIEVGWEAAARIQDCIFEGNVVSTGNAGGAVYLGGASADIINCRFVGNHVDGDGGAIAHELASVTIVNCSFEGNSATGHGGAIVGRATTGEVHNSILWGNSAPDGEQIALREATSIEVSYSDVQGGEAGVSFENTPPTWLAGNIDADPLFVDPKNGDLHLSPGSPCIDAADNTAVPGDVTTDLDGNPRFVDDPDTPDTGNGDPPLVDMGAYEYQPLVTETICPDDPDDSFKAFGGPVTGDALDLCDDDGVRLQVLQASSLTPLMPHLRLEFWANTTLDDGISQLDYHINCHVSAVVAGGQNPNTLRTSIRNFAAGQWSLRDQRATPSNADVDIDIVESSNPNDYVNAGDGEIRVRQDAFNPGNVAFPLWFLKVDQYEVTVTAEP